MSNDKFVPCNINRCVDGYIYFQKNGREKVRKCKCLINYQNKIKLKYELEKANIHDSIIDYKIESYIGDDHNKNLPKLKKIINRFDLFRDKVIYFYGKPGTQKTTLSYWVGKELLKKKYSVQFILMNDLIKLLMEQDSFDNKEDLIQKYFDCDCLIIDRSFHKEQVTMFRSGYQLPFLDSFLRKRLDTLHKNIIIISNTEINNISKNGFSDDIEDLIRRNAVVHNTVLFFEDHYSLKNDFDKIDLWSD